MTSEGPRTGKNLDEHSLEVVTKRLSEAVSRILPELPQGMSMDAQKQMVIARLEDRARNIFPEHKDAVAELGERLRKSNFSSREEMVKGIADQTASFLTTVEPPEMLETRLREETAELSGWKKVNEALSYDLESNGEVSLHVPMMFTKKPLEMIGLFEAGLRELASRMKSDPELSDVKEVSGYSWIIFEHPNLLKKMGFTIGERNENERKAFASMNREDFIKRYSN